MRVSETMNPQNKDNKPLLNRRAFLTTAAGAAAGTALPSAFSAAQLSVKTLSGYGRAEAWRKRSFRPISGIRLKPE